MSGNHPSEADEFVGELLDECTENLDQLERALLLLENDPRSTRALDNAFRAIHTIKGSSALFGLSRIEAVAHLGESVLSGLRDATLSFTTERASALLAMADLLRQILRQVGEQRGEEGIDCAAVLERLHTATQAGADAVAKAADPTQPAGPVEPVADRTLRVDVQLLDRLMDLAGELVLARNQMMRLAPANPDGSFAATAQRLNLITSALQEGVMKTRMQPIGGVFEKLPRVVRDVALQCGKHARLEIHGGETDLDKTLLEAIKDPLTHLVRNAVDHGIEGPEVRKARGKPLEGLLSFRAFHESGQVNIVLSDDGGGIDVERVKHKALERALITAEQANRMADEQLLNLIFLPGFSTAQTVTQISGRGVGMDVVKTNIERIGGEIELQSIAGRGTTIRIKIPLTLAIIPALIVRSGGERYAIPQVSLFELVRPKRDATSRGIETIQGASVYRLRGRLLPLLRLDRQLEGHAAADADLDAASIVVLEANGQQFGLIVDRIDDTVEIVVKPLARQLRGLPLFAGASIMSDGMVALILDVAHLARRAHATAPPRVEEQQTQASSRPSQALVLVADGRGAQLAVSLSAVVRLEKFLPARIEGPPDRQVVQYRGRILPLLSVGRLLGSGQPQPPGGDCLHVLVCAHEGRDVGLIVDRIVDIVEGDFVFQATEHAVGRLGSTVIQSKVTELLDLPALLDAAFPPAQSAHV